VTPKCAVLNLLNNVCMYLKERMHEEFLKYRKQETNWKNNHVSSSCGAAKHAIIIISKQLSLAWL
jgi:hypothetical protein